MKKFVLYAFLFFAVPIYGSDNFDSRYEREMEAELHILQYNLLKISEQLYSLEAKISAPEIERIRLQLKKCEAAVQNIAFTYVMGYTDKS